MKQMNQDDRLLLAQKIMSEKIDINSLADDEVEEMINFFTKYICDTDRKMEKIKQNILKIRKTFNRK